MAEQAKGMVITTNPYRVAGENASMEILREIVSAVEKRADIECFQLETLLTIIKNDIAPLIMVAMDPKLPFLYIAMKKIVESMLDRQKKAQEQHEQRGYSYGFPASEEMDFEPGAFNFNTY